MHIADFPEEEVMGRLSLIRTEELHDDYSPREALTSKTDGASHSACTHIKKTLKDIMQTLLHQQNMPFIH